MELTTAKCPECGADLKIPEGKDVIVCDYCGANIIVKDLFGPGSMMQNYLSLAETAMQGGSYKEAYDYYNKVLEINAANSGAWFGKAVCAGGMTTLNDSKFDEMLVLFENAIKNTPADKQDEMKQKAALAINEQVMRVVNDIRSGKVMKFEHGFEGGIAAEAMSILPNLKHFADESEKALEKALTYMPGNKEISNNLDELQKQMKKTGSMLSVKDINIPGGQTQGKSTSNLRSAGASLLMRFIILVIFLIGGYAMVKKYLVKDISVKNIVKELTTEKSTPDYTIADITPQDGAVYISVYTASNTDDDLVKINKEVVDKYNPVYKLIYVNYFSDKNSASENTELQFKHNRIWITKNASSLGLKATMEYEAGKHISKFYKYSDGKTVSVSQPEN
jgi:DNA-directed RNA polymerase subunit RPC12/RpoP